jgi:hypothetical protein
MWFVGFSDAVFGAPLSQGDWGLFRLPAPISFHKHLFLEG